MGQVTVTMNGRTYRLSCEDGEEERLRALASYVDERFSKFVDEFGQVGQDRLMLMTALVMADEIFEQRDHLNGAARTAASALRDAVKSAKTNSKSNTPGKTVVDLQAEPEGPSQDGGDVQNDDDLVMPTKESQAS